MYSLTLKLITKPINFNFQALNIAID